MSKPAIALRGIVKRSGKVSILDGINATIEAGQLVGLVGPPGCGKTTLIRLIAGLLRPDAGTIEVLGHDVLGEPAAVQALIGYMPQRPGLYEALTLIENLELHADLRNVPYDVQRERVGELLQRCGLAHLGRHRVGALSDTMKQKLALACALVATPRLLLLDEPSVALDPVSRRQLFRFVQSLMAQGTTVLWGTARFDEAERCGHVLLLNEGRVIAQGPPPGLRARLAGRTHAICASGPERRDVAARLRAMPGVGDVQTYGTTVRFSTGTPEDEVELQRFACIGLPRTIAPRLEDSFIALTAGSSAPAAAAPCIRPRPTLSVDVIEARRLRKRFGDVVAVDDVNFGVAPGEIFGLIGPNGAGKTTILRLLCGLLSPTAGEALIAGLDLWTAPAGARARIGYMNQGFSLYGELSVAQNLRFLADAHKLERSRRRARVEDLISEFGLRSYADVRSAQLPAGARQRAALAASLVHQPSVILLDEPTAGADPLTRRDIWRRIDALAADGVAIVVASDFIEEAEYCDRVMLAYFGCAIAVGRPDELKAAVGAGPGSEPTLEDAFVARIEDWERRRAA